MYTTGEVCRIYDIPMVTLRDWINRGFVYYDIEPPEKGKRGYFTYNSVYKMGLFMILSSFLKRKHAAYVINNINQANGPAHDILKLGIFYTKEGKLSIYGYGLEATRYPFISQQERWMRLACMIDMRGIREEIHNKIHNIKPKARRSDWKQNEVMRDIVEFLKCMKITNDAAVSRRFGYSRTTIRPVKRYMLKNGMIELVGKTKYRLKTRRQRTGD